MHSLHTISRRTNYMTRLTKKIELKVLRKSYILDSVVFSKCNTFAQNFRLCEPQAKQSSAISEQSVVLDCFAYGSQRRSPEFERRFEKNYGIEYITELTQNVEIKADLIFNEGV